MWGTCEQHVPIRLLKVSKADQDYGANKLQLSSGVVEWCDIVVCSCGGHVEGMCGISPCEKWLLWFQKTPLIMVGKALQGVDLLGVHIDLLCPLHSSDEHITVHVRSGYCVCVCVCTQYGRGGRKSR